MRMLRSSFTLRLLGGFVLGTAGMVAVHAASATGMPASIDAPSTHATR